MLWGGQLVATLLVTWFVVDRAGVSLAELRDFDLSSWTLRPVLLAASCAALAGGYLITGALWGRIVADLGGGRLGSLAAARLFMIANLGRYVPGKVWQIAGLAALARQRGIPAPTAAASAVLGQGVAVASAAAVGIGGLWSYAGDTPWRWAVPTTLLIGMGVGLTPPVFTKVAETAFRLARTEYPVGLDARRGGEWLMIGLVSWTVYAGAFWLLVSGLGYELPFVSTASSFAAAYVIGYVVIFAPAGIGVREGALVVFLGPQIGYAAAGAVAALGRLWTTAVEVVPAAAFWGLHLRAGEGEGTP